MALLVLAACQPFPEVAETKRETAERPQTAKSPPKSKINKVEPAEEAVAVVGAGPPLIVVQGRAEKIARCLHGKLVEHPGLTSMGLGPAPLQAMDDGTFRLMPRKAIRVQLGTTNKSTSKTEETGRMTYTTTVAPAGGGQTAVYFQADAPNLSGTVLSSLLDAVRKTTRRQARVCAL